MSLAALTSSDDRGCAVGDRAKPGTRPAENTTLQARNKLRQTGDAFHTGARDHAALVRARAFTHLNERTFPAVEDSPGKAFGTGAGSPRRGLETHSVTK
jgi:hypothetical protein